MISNPIPISNPRGTIICYNNLLVSATTTDGDKALTPNTWERWRPSSGAVTMKFQLSSATNIDYIAIGAHGLSGETFKLQTATTIGGALTDVESFSPSDNSALIALFETQSVAEIAFVSTLTAVSEIGSIFAGQRLQMPQAVSGDHSPLSLSPVTQYQNVGSESGQFLGRNIVRKGSSAPFDWEYLDPDWIREYFKPFMNAAKSKPFFIVDRPDLYSNEVSLVHTNQDIRPVNMGGGHRLMSVSMSVNGHEDI